VHETRARLRDQQHMHVFGLVTLDAGSTRQLASEDKFVLDKALINLVPKQVNNLHILRQQTLAAPSCCDSRALALAYINPLPPTRKGDNGRSSEALPCRYTLERSFHIRLPRPLGGEAGRRHRPPPSQDRRLPWSTAKSASASRSEATWLLCSSSALQVDYGFHLYLCHRCIIHAAPLVSHTVHSRHRQESS
jgi:hypothetical protein